VVDDNRDSTASMTTLLRLLGNKVRIAHDGLEAVQVAGEFHPQVILMDIGMPRLNGYDATRRIREQPWGREVKIVALTGWGNLEADAGESPGGEGRGPDRAKVQRRSSPVPGNGLRRALSWCAGRARRPENVLLRLQEEGAPPEGDE
jgi:hypothetical protein